MQDRTHAGRFDSDRERVEFLVFHRNKTTVPYPIDAVVRVYLIGVSCYPSSVLRKPIDRPARRTQVNLIPEHKDRITTVNDLRRCAYAYYIGSVGHNGTKRQYYGQ